MASDGVTLSLLLTPLVICSAGFNFGEDMRIKYIVLVAILTYGIYVYRKTDRPVENREPTPLIALKGLVYAIIIPTLVVLMGSISLTHHKKVIGFMYHMRHIAKDAAVYTTENVLTSITGVLKGIFHIIVSIPQMNVMAFLRGQQEILQPLLNLLYFIGYIIMALLSILLCPLFLLTQKEGLYTFPINAMVTIKDYEIDSSVKTLLDYMEETLEDYEPQAAAIVDGSTTLTLKHTLLTFFSYMVAIVIACACFIGLTPMVNKGTVSEDVRAGATVSTLSLGLVINGESVNKILNETFTFIVDSMNGTGDSALLSFTKASLLLVLLPIVLILALISVYT